jgi:hypothetical protein
VRISNAIRIRLEDLKRLIGEADWRSRAPRVRRPAVERDELREEMRPDAAAADGKAAHYPPTPSRPSLPRMEAEVVEDKKKAKPCDCGHPAGLHELDGVGPCSAAGCGCRGLAVTEDEVTTDGSRHTVPVVRFGLRALDGASPVGDTLGVR